jgi:foldase protein PrsA
VYQLNRPGQLSGVIKSSYGYHLVKYLGRRPVTYDAVEDKIMNLLFQQKIAEQFKRWVVEKRREADIKIFMDDYKKA